MNTFQSLHNLFGFHAFYKTAHTLGVTIATSIKLNIVNDSVNDFKLNHLTASALGVIGVFHKSNDKSYQWYGMQR